MRLNPPAAADTPENRSGGILLVLQPGYGPDPDGRDPVQLVRPRGLLTSAQIDRGPLLPRVLRWLAEAGLNLRTAAPALQLTVWPERFEGEPYAAQRIKALAVQSGDFLDTVARRRPRLIVFVSAYLHDALLEPGVSARFAETVGRACEPPRRLTTGRLRARIQRWEKAIVISVPVPCLSVTPAFETELTAALRRETGDLFASFSLSDRGNRS